MTKSLSMFTAAVLAAGAITTAGTADAASARFTIRGYVPLICNASIVSKDVTEGASLRIDAMVNQSCNAKHQMAVRFTTEADTGGLSVQYNGSSPTVVSLGLRGFGQERYARAVRALRIVYSGGTPAQRQALAQTVTIEVTPL